MFADQDVGRACGPHGAAWTDADAPRPRRKWFSADQRCPSTAGDADPFRPRRICGAHTRTHARQRHTQEAFKDKTLTQIKAAQKRVNKEYGNIRSEMNRTVLHLRALGAIRTIEPEHYPDAFNRLRTRAGRTCQLRALNGNNKHKDKDLVVATAFRALRGIHPTPTMKAAALLWVCHFRRAQVGWQREERQRQRTNMLRERRDDGRGTRN